MRIFTDIVLLVAFVTIVVFALAHRRELITMAENAFTGARLLLNQASAASGASLIDAVSAANTAAATSGSGKWLDVRPYDGEMLVIQQVGAVTGSITGKCQSASDANGTGAADITGATFTIVSSSNNTQSIAVDPRKVVGGFLGYVGTIATGPSLVSVTAFGKKHTV
jgi:hypothetical protein